MVTPNPPVSLNTIVSQNPDDRVAMLTTLDADNNEGQTRRGQLYMRDGRVLLLQLSSYAEGANC